MPKFREKPVEIEAMQYDGKNHYEIIEWAHKGLPDIAPSRIRFIESSLLLCYTPTGEDMFARAGDWIIKGTKGKFYSCKPEIFNKKFERIGDNKPVLLC